MPRGRRERVGEAQPMQMSELHPRLLVLLRRHSSFWVVGSCWSERIVFLFTADLLMMCEELQRL